MDLSRQILVKCCRPAFITRGLTCRGGRGAPFNTIRCMSSITGRKLEYAQYGIPAEVIEVKEMEIPGELAPGKVLVRMLACPVNPADINVIQGSYPIRAPLPAVAGGEGVGEVVGVGAGVTSIQPGDWVLPSAPMSGTWRTHSLLTEADLIQIRNDIPMEVAATLQINPATAYRMLKDFVELQEGDWVVQNGANSAVGLAVIQIAKEMKLKTINVVRDRDEICELKTALTSLGADIVLTEEEARKAWREVPRPRLAFNCVGGASSTELCKALGDKGVHVTYGGMSLKPVVAATSHLIFKDIQLRGFWLGKWSQGQGRSAKRLDMYTKLAGMAAAGTLSAPPLTPLPIQDYKLALESTLRGYKTGKFMFVMK